MPGAVSACGPDRSSHAWTDVGDRRVCRECGLLDFDWSLARRQMIEALRRAGSPNPGVR